MQVRQKNTFISSFGGINFINHFLKSRDFSSIVEQNLGKRSPKAGYGYADLIKQMFFTAAIGGTSLDENNYLKEQLSDHPSLKIASPDTIEYAFQELRTKTKNIPSKSGAIHQVNEHGGFNKLLAAISSRYLFSRQGNYLLDYDGHSVENTKPDRAYTYKQTEGYYPVVCSIDKMPVYMQNRNGNTPESYGQRSIIRKALENCRSHGIAITKFRADACCYEQATLKYLEQEGIIYYIRAERSRMLMDAFEDEPDWEEVLIGANHRKIEITSLEEKVFSENKYRRIIVYREKVKGQLEISDINGYRYSAVITSDRASSPAKVLQIYNRRGCQGEHHFKELDEDFNWNKLPFDNMEMNTVYMYVMALTYLLFNAVKKSYSRKVSFVEKGMRIKKFILHFVTLPAKWIKTGRSWVLNIYTRKNYALLWDV